MKALKIAVFVVLGLFVLLVVAVVVLSVPAVQKTLVTRLASSEEDGTLELEYFHAGLNQTEIRGLDFEKPDASYQAEEVTAELSLFDLLFRRQLRLGEVVASGLVIDVSRMEPKEGEKEKPFEGILNAMDLPMPVYLDQIRATGEVLLASASGEEPAVAEFELTGGGIAPGEEGEMDLVGDFDASGTAGMLRSLDVEGDLSLVQAEGGQIDRARLRLLLSVPGMTDGSTEKLSADVLLVSTEEGESYEGRVRRVQANQPDQADLSSLIVVDATYQREEGILEGRWKLAVDEEQLAAYMGEMELPAFAANGEGEFTYGTGGELAAAGQVDVSIEDLGKISGELAELGRFDLQSRFDLAMDQDAFRLEELVVEVRGGEGQDLLEVRNFEPIRYDREAGRLEGAEGRLDLAEVTVHALPVEWANLFLPERQNQPGLTLRGGNLTGQLLVSSDAGAVLFRFVEPLQAEGIGFYSGEKALATDVAFQASGSGSFQEGNLQAEIGPLELSSGGKQFLVASGNVDTGAGNLEANMESDLPVLLELPALAEYNNLSSGTLTLQAALAGEAVREIEMSGVARDLVTREEEKALPDVVWEGTVRESATNVWQVDVPLRLEAATPSDLRLAGELTAEGEVKQFDLRLTGEQLLVEDLTALASAFSPPDPSGPTDEAPPAEPPGARDEDPFWAGVAGQLTVDLATVQIQKDYRLNDLNGSLSVEADAIASSVEAVFLDEPVEAAAELRFVAAEEEPYVLEGTVEAPNLPVGDIFREFQPDRPPTVEGIFVASLQLDGTGRNLPDLIDGIRGEVRMKSGGGVIRLLYTENPLAGLGVAATSILGTLGGEVGAVSRAASQLSNMTYSEVNLLAERDEQLNFVLQDFSVLAPDLHLEGAGKIQYREGVPILKQPMEIRLRMGARGALEETLGSIGVLGEETDEQGYVPLRHDFVISGTLANPDTTSFYGMLVDTVLQYVVPEDEPADEDEERSVIPEIPDVLDILGGRR